MSQLDVVARTHRIKVPSGSAGTAFMIDIDDRQYVVTAKHLVQDSIDALHIFWDGNWQPLPVGLVGHCEGETDISVLYTNQDLPKMLYPEGSGLGIEPDLKLGEEVFFYGFPHGWSTPLSSGRGHVPLVKRGIVSGFFGAPLGSGEESLLIDGHNNPGFSGGPVVSVRNGQYKVAGVIAGYRYSYQEVYGTDSSGRVDESIIVGYLPENTGVVVAHNIKPALDMIEKNPIGLPLSQSV